MSGLKQKVTGLLGITKEVLRVIWTLRNWFSEWKHLDFDFKKVSSHKSVRRGLKNFLSAFRLPSNCSSSSFTSIDKVVKGANSYGVMLILFLLHLFSSFGWCSEIYVDERFPRENSRRLYKVKKALVLYFFCYFFKDSFIQFTFNYSTIKFFRPSHFHTTLKHKSLVRALTVNITHSFRVLWLLGNITFNNELPHCRRAKGRERITSSSKLELILSQENFYSLDYVWISHTFLWKVMENSCSLVFFLKVFFVLMF